MSVGWTETEVVMVVVGCDEVDVELSIGSVRFASTKSTEMKEEEAHWRQFEFSFSFSQHTYGPMI